MPVNGFVTGRRVWVEIVCGSLRADFLGVVNRISEAEEQHYHIQFKGGFEMSFHQTDLDTGRVKVHDHQPNGR